MNELRQIVRARPDSSQASGSDGPLKTQLVQAPAVQVPAVQPTNMPAEPLEPTSPPQRRLSMRSRGRGKEQRAPGRVRKASLDEVAKEAWPPDVSETYDTEASAPRPPMLHSNKQINRTGGAGPKSTSSRRRANSAQAAKSRKNPFAAYDTREFWLVQEHRWVQDDEKFFLEKKEDLRVSSLLKKLASWDASEQDLYERRTFFGPHSVKLKAKKAAKVADASAMVPWKEGQRPNSAAEVMTTIKKLQQELESSQLGLGAERQTSKKVTMERFKDLQLGLLERMTFASTAT